ALVEPRFVPLTRNGFLAFGERSLARPDPGLHARTGQERLDTGRSAEHRREHPVARLPAIGGRTEPELGLPWHHADPQLGGELHELRRVLLQEFDEGLEQLAEPAEVTR